MDCDRTSLNSAQKWEQAWIVTEHLPNDAGKSEAWIVTEHLSNAAEKWE
jgi:hypothetical protein